MGFTGGSGTNPRCFPAGYCSAHRKREAPSPENRRQGSHSTLRNRVFCAGTTRKAPKMNESLDTIKRLIDGCSDADRKALQFYLRKLAPHPMERLWGIDADTILSAIGRSSDLTKRGIRGIIAEAVFVSDIIPAVRVGGWFRVEFDGDHPYDAQLRNGGLTARIQVKLQRLQKGTPKHYLPSRHERGTLFVVEVQKTRTGERGSKKTRPYSFGDFDILAVNMHPSSGNWRSFRYTVGSWLIPRPADIGLIEIMQPVAAEPNDVWTDDLSTCLDWYASGAQRTVLPGSPAIEAANLP